MLKIFKQGGFASIVEVVITSVIFIVAMFGVLSAASSMRPLSKESFDNLKSYYIAETAYQPLFSGVSADQWLNATGTLAPGVLRTSSVNSIGESWPTHYYNYEINYILTDVAGYPAGEGPRLLTVNILTSAQ